MKALIVSDIHIYDYPNRNPYPEYRLNQYKLVAKNIIDVGKSEECGIVIIAGDIFEKSTTPPEIVHAAKDFLNIIMKEFEIGYIIAGNHDLKNKSNSQKYINTYFTAILPENLHYVDGKILTIGNTSVAFCNWKPEFDLSWIHNKVDLLISHATISYNQYDRFTSQYLDQSKFDLAILGDIHKPDKLGKFVSIGCSQKCKMGDSDKQTGVVFNFIDKSWKHVDLNPYDNLMKFKYTSVKSKEGWCEDKNTWYVYKSGGSKSNSNGTEISIPKWDEINNLVNDIIKVNGLSDIHNEVMLSIKSMDDSEVDFNFTLTRLTLSNFRSIEDCDIEFNEGDKILITGENGNGKSSLLLGLKYALIENRFIKDFIKFETDRCTASVELLYQNKKYKILRGSKDYGLWINDNKLTYNNKKEFEEDVHRHLPFIDYMDIYFFTSDVSKIIGSISPERRSDIISKFYKLDKIDQFNESAQALYNSEKLSIDDTISKLSVDKDRLSYLSDKLNSMTLPTDSYDVLQNRKNVLDVMYNKHIEYIQYINNVTALTSKKSSIEWSINNTHDKIISLGDIQDIITKVSELRNESVSINNEIQLLERNRTEYYNLKSELSGIISSGTTLVNQMNSIKSNICPTCSQSVNEDQIKEYKSSLESQINDLLSKKDSVEKKISSLNFNESIINSKRERLSSLSSSIYQYDSIINTYKSYEADLSKLDKDLKDIDNQINNIPVAYEVSLPDNYNEIMSSILNDLNIYAQYNSIKSEYDTLSNDISKRELEINSIKDKLDRIFKYISLTSSTGKIYEEIMSRLAVEFSDNLVKYEVNTYKFRGKDHLELAPYYNVKGRWVAYQSLSSGQATVTDINFLSKVITRNGLLIMDEFLKHLSQANHDICIDILSRMNIGCIMLSSHMESITTFNNRTFELMLSDNGSTIINQL